MTVRRNPERPFQPALAWGLLALAVLTIVLPALWLERFWGGSGKADLHTLSDIRFQVDINRASLAELQALPGIGPRLAGRIAEHRQRIGSFARLEDLRQVKGMGAVLYHQVLPHLSLGTPASSQME
jgi:competence ComEA-like helix-hairpin-helix protein